VKAQPQPVIDILYHKKQEAAERLGFLDAKVVQFAPILKEHEALRKQIQAFFDQSPAAEPFTIESPSYVVAIEARSFERRIVNMAALAKTLGKGFWKLAKMNLSDLEAFVSEPLRSKFLKTTQTGSRKVTVQAKPLQKAA
jgi:hypothetical protein